MSSENSQTHDGLFASYSLSIHRHAIRKVAIHSLIIIALQLQRPMHPLLSTASAPQQGRTEYRGNAPKVGITSQSHQQGDNER